MESNGSKSAESLYDRAAPRKAVNLSLNEDLVAQVKALTMRTAEHDWSRLDAMTEEERHAAAVADPDAQPFTESDMADVKLTRRTKVIQNDTPPSGDHAAGTTMTAESGT